ncbi:hypothetical protein K9N50_01580 [bacterium]|nr:hypothetical protein [bacterium]
MKYLIAILIPLLTFIGCTDKYDFMIPASDEIWPLAESNKWTYDASATIIDTNSIRATVLIWVDSTFFWNDEFPWYTLKTISNLLPLNLSYRLEEDGLHRLTFSLDSSAATNELYLKYPCEVNEGWTLSNGNTVILLSDNDQVNNTLGNYTGCYRYKESYSGGGYNEVSLFPGIGPLLMDYTITSPIGRLKAKAELVNYEVN